MLALQPNEVPNKKLNHGGTEDTEKYFCLKTMRRQVFGRARLLPSRESYDVPSSAGASPSLFKQSLIFANETFGGRTLISAD